MSIEYLLINISILLGIK